MKLLKYIPLQFVIFQIIGIICGYYFSFTAYTIAIVLLLALFGLTTSYFISLKTIIQKSYFTILTFLIFFVIGVASMTFNNSIQKKDHYSSFLSDTNNATLIIDEILKPNLYNDRYFAKVTSINSSKTQGKILLNVQKDSANKVLNVDDKIFVTHSFDLVKGPTNPYQFNYKDYLKKLQVFHQINIKNKEYLLLENDNRSLKGMAFSIRTFINGALDRFNFKGDELAIINALLLGQRQEISNDLLSTYQNAGVVHILAVSGLHVGIILIILTFLLNPLNNLKHGVIIKLIITVFLLWCFALIAGLSASIIRAVTMFTAIAISLTANQKISTYKALIISVFVLLMFNPFYLFNVGFQLSYLAVFFILWIQPMLYKIWKPKLKIIDYFWQLLTVSVAAQVGVLPLSIYYFHQFPGLFFIANLIIIPFLGIILGLGILVIVFALLNILPDILASFYRYIISALNLVVEWIAAKESFLFQNIYFSELTVLFYFLIIISLFKFLEIKKFKYLKFSLFAAILFQLNLIVEKYYDHSTNEFIIFNKTRETIIGIRKGNDLQLNHTLDTVIINNENIVKSYLTGSKSKLNFTVKNIDNVYSFNNKNILVVDSLGIYNLQNHDFQYVLLRDSPNINLLRLIKHLKPELIIADASNFKSRVAFWQKTCGTHNIKFHYTVTHGAFIVN